MNHYDPTDLRGQDRIREETDARKRNDLKTSEADLKWLMSSPRGRRIMWRLFVQAGVFQRTFSTNAMQMAFNEGNRNYGVTLLDQINAICPELYPVMCKEQKDVGNGNGNGHKSN